MPRRTERRSPDVSPRADCYASSVVPPSRFRFAPFGARVSDEHASCDGLVAGAGLDLSHWAKNATPAHVKRDTSVEIALAYAKSAPDEAGRRPVANNHFDADGVLAVWCLLEPEVALAHESLVVAAAEAGDFDEWPSDERGLRLEAAVRALARGARSDEEAYARALPALPSLVSDLDAHEALYRDDWDALLRDAGAAERGELVVERVGRIAVLLHREGVSEIAGPVLSRALPDGTDRLLLVFDRGSGRFDYRYELPRHAWADTVVRPTLAPPSKNALAARMAEPSAWAIKGELGMTGLLRTKAPIAARPEDVAEALAAADSA